jgi:hypothetical protein
LQHFFISGKIEKIMTKFQELLSQHIASSLLKQQNLIAFLSDHNWNVDLEVNGTWLWGWANEGSNILTSLLTCAMTLRALGTKKEIQELTQPQIELNEVNGHMLAMVACGICNADAYYRGPYNGGALFFTMQQMPLQKQQGASPTELISIMSSVISQFPVNHKTMAQSFLNQQGYSLAESEGKIVASAENGNDITLVLDELGRISNLETTAVPEPQAAYKKSWWRFGK